MMTEVWFEYPSDRLLKIETVPRKCVNNDIENELHVMGTLLNV